MKVAIYTLGCKVNQYETQAMEQELLARGHTLTEFSDEADAYIVNTCSVTAVSDQKSRQVIHGVQRKHPGAVVAVCGCYPQTHADDVRKLGVDLISGTGDRTGFIRLLEEAAAEKRQIEAIDQPFERRVFEVLPAGGLGGRTRAMLKVEDGCVNFCTYCIIPYARGRVRSLPVPTAVEQTRALAAEGYREIDLMGGFECNHTLISPVRGGWPGRSLPQRADSPQASGVPAGHRSPSAARSPYDRPRAAP